MSAGTPKPCPFCGNRHAEAERRGGLASPTFWFVWCRNCDAHGPAERDEGAAVEAWNERQS